MMQRNAARWMTWAITLAVSFALIGAANAQPATADSETEKPKKKKAAKKQRKPKPALLPIEDDPNLPRVLLLGDSISIGYTLPTRKLLKGKANLHRALDNCGPSSQGVKRLKKWLGENKWDVIHFNFGLHDLRQSPKTEAVQVPIERYEKNLKTITAQLKETGAVLVWASTTPVQDAKTSPRAKRTDKDVQAYNEVATKIMKAENIRTNDLNAAAMDGPLAEIQNKDGVHFSKKGSNLLAKRVAAAIKQALKAKK